MSNIQTETRTVTQHRFIVPCEQPWGGTPADLGLAIHVAKEKAKELGINTTYDDWCSLHVEDDQLVLVLEEVK